VAFWGFCISPPFFNMLRHIYGKYVAYLSPINETLIYKFNSVIYYLCCK
jgi:hypothetical protein